MENRHTIGRSLCTCAVAALVASCDGGGSPLSPSAAGPFARARAIAGAHAKRSASYTVIYNFGRAEDGTTPRAAPVAFQGTLYGTT
jgi:hypothetical protein